MTSTVAYSVFKTSFRPNLTFYSIESIILCSFRNISSSYYGGGLYINASVSVSIEDSSFVSCNSQSDYGGGFYFQSLSEAVLQRICFYDCYAITYGQTGFVQAPNGSVSINMYSFIFCPRNYEGAWIGIYCGYSNQTLSNINSSHCLPSVKDPSIGCFNSDGTSISFSNTESDNGSIIFEITRGPDTRKVGSSNFINNTFGATDGTLIYCYGSATFYSCIFLNNKHSVMFNSMGGGTVVVQNCFFDKTVTSAYGTVTLSGITIGAATATIKISSNDIRKCLIAASFTVTNYDAYIRIASFALLSLPLLMLF